MVAHGVAGVEQCRLTDSTHSACPPFRRHGRRTSARPFCCNTGLLQPRKSINKGELDRRIGCSSVLDRVPEVKARFHSDPGHTNNFRNCWGTVKKKCLAQGALFGTPKQRAEPLSPEPGDDAPSRRPPSLSSPPRTSRRIDASSSFEDFGYTPPSTMHGTPMMFGAPTPPAAQTPPRHRGASSASGPHGSVDDLSRWIGSNLRLSEQGPKLHVTRIPFEDELTNQCLQLMIRVPSGVCDCEAKVCPGGNQAVVEWNLPNALLVPAHLKTEVEALGTLFQNNAKKLVDVRRKP
jgi:hypothetical protein